ncbi:MAG: heme-binding protein [Pseudomonadota bacterium]
MSFTRQSQVLTHEGVLEMLRAAVAEAQSIGQPQCIVVVDGSGELLGEIRMTGAKYLSRKSARAKARTSASIGAPSAAIPEAVRPHIAAATGGEVTGLGGGLPIQVDGAVLGGIGVGSGSPDQDLAVARAALAAIGARTEFG